MIGITVESCLLTSLVISELLLLVSAETCRRLGPNPVEVAFWRGVVLLVVVGLFAVGLVVGVLAERALGSTCLISLVVAALLVSLVADSRHKPLR